jgi:hypothetical protein
MSRMSLDYEHLERSSFMSKLRKILESVFDSEPGPSDDEVERAFLTLNIQLKRFVKIASAKKKSSSDGDG